MFLICLAYLSSLIALACFPGTKYTGKPPRAFWISILFMFIALVSTCCIMVMVFNILNRAPIIDSREIQAVYELEPFQFGIDTVEGTNSTHESIYYAALTNDDQYIFYQKELQQNGILNISPKVVSAEQVSIINASYSTPIVTEAIVSSKIQITKFENWCVGKVFEIPLEWVVTEYELLIPKDSLLEICEAK